MRYTCHGIKVSFPQRLQPHPDFMPSGRYEECVGQMLDKIEIGDWYEKTTLTMWFPAPIAPLAVDVEVDAKRLWGVHRYHKMSRPGLSPFVERQPLPEQLGFITIDVLRLRNSVLLYRAYGGQRVQSLPWMKTENRNDALQYWHEHAFMARGHYMIQPNTAVLRQPEWFRPEHASH